MNKVNVVFIAPEEYNNLGIGYLSSVLKGAGYRARIIDFKKSRKDILRILKQSEPDIIGFSIICYDFLKEFGALIDFLRKAGIRSHFTSGGHYPSLKTRELFSLIPALDSVVRFEGENTMLELTGKIISGMEWRDTEGIAYRQNGSVIFNRLRPLEKDIDQFPYPYRTHLRKFAFDMAMATILAGRGCLGNCSFCNTRKFYENPGGPLKRIRKPELVVSEMKMLHRKRKCSVFLFMDDDFPVRPAKDTDWPLRFCNELEKENLNDKIIWKISCRVDEVEAERFSIMKRNGLFLVFIGIEDGTDAGLKRMNKHITSAQIKKSVGILKKLDLGIDFGFLLFQPSTTFRSLNENLDFLLEICGDGYMPVAFQKLMPFYGTRVETELIEEGRLISGSFIQDYDFYDEAMNSYYRFTYECFSEWLTYPYGVQNLSNWVRNYFLVYSRYFGKDRSWNKLNRKFRGIIAESNLFVLDTMKDLSLLFENGEYKKNGNLDEFRDGIRKKHKHYQRKVYDYFDSLYNLAILSFIESQGKS